MKTTADVVQWLQGLGFERFAALFEANEIEAEVLPDLNIADLSSMQIPIGPAKKILKAIQALEAAGSAADSVSLVGSTSSVTATLTPRPATATEPERRQLTIMFCDMVGSTALAIC